MQFDSLTLELRAFMVMQSARWIAGACSDSVGARMDQDFGMQRVAKLPRKIMLISLVASIFPIVIVLTSLIWNWPANGWVIDSGCTIVFSLAALLIWFQARLASHTLDEAKNLRLQIHNAMLQATKTLAVLILKDGLAAAAVH